MTDMEKLTKLLLGFGVEFEVFTNASKELIVVSMGEGTRKVDGYPGYRTDFNFTAGGSFLDVGIWE